MGRFSVRFHHGGAFKTTIGGKMSYEGGKVYTLSDIDDDEACIFDLKRTCDEKLGCSKGFVIWYNTKPGKSMVRNWKVLENDSDILELVRNKDVHGYVDVYVVGLGVDVEKDSNMGFEGTKEQPQPYDMQPNDAQMDQGPNHVAGSCNSRIDSPTPTTTSNTDSLHKKLTPRRKNSNGEGIRKKRLSEGKSKKAEKTKGKSVRSKSTKKSSLLPVIEDESDDGDLNNDFDDENLNDWSTENVVKGLIEVVKQKLGEKRATQASKKVESSKEVRVTSQALTILGENDFSDDELDVSYHADTDESDGDSLVSLCDSDEDVDLYPEFNPKADFQKPICLTKGLKFSSNDLFRKAVRFHAIQSGYDYYFLHNDNTRVTIYCKDRCPCPFKKGKKINCICNGKFKCHFRVHASKVKDECTFQIKSMCLDHKCGWKTMNSKLTSEYLADIYIENWRSDPSWKLKAFKDQVMRDSGVEIGYAKAWYARARAKLMIYGVCADQYKQVWEYVQAIIKYIPGSSGVVQVDNIERTPPHFERMYICLEGCKEGFKRGCRPLIGVDGCHLKGAYPGICLVAVGKDGNNNIFPIAWAVVEVENTNSWSWFLELLLKDLGENAGDQPWTFMSDRQKGLLEAFRTVAPTSFQRYCCRHIWQNFKGEFPGKVFKDSFWNAARSATKDEFKGHMEGIKLLSHGAYSYLANIPAEHWSKHAFDKRCKSDMLLNNLCECFNSVIKEARDQPILTQMEWMRKYVMKRHVAKLDGVSKVEGNIMPFALKKFEWIERESRSCIVVPAGIDEFEVEHKGDTYVVKLAERSCTCFMWDLTGIPCCHAFRCFHNNRLDPSDYVHEAYGKDRFKLAYGTPLHGMPGRKHWEETPYPQPDPPIIRIMPGRPSNKKRRLEAGEAEERKNVKRPYKKNACGKCGDLGHYKTKCQNLVAPKDPNVKKSKGGRPSIGGTWTPRGRIPEKKRKPKGNTNATEGGTSGAENDNNASSNQEIISSMAAECDGGSQTSNLVDQQQQRPPWRP